MKIIDFEDIIKLNIPIDQSYKWAEEMIKDKKSAILPPKISMSPVEGSFCNVMPCILGKWGGKGC